MLELIARQLRLIADNIDSGNSTLTEAESIELMDMLQRLNDPYISKYQACMFLGISRAKFDMLVQEGKLPRGKKRAGFKELAWKKSDILIKHS